MCDLFSSFLFLSFFFCVQVIIPTCFNFPYTYAVFAYKSVQIAVKFPQKTNGFAREKNLQSGDKASDLYENFTISSVKNSLLFPLFNE